MAPGSFECLLHTRGSNHIKQQEERRSNPALWVLAALSLGLFHSFMSLVFSMFVSLVNQASFFWADGSRQRADTTLENAKIQACKKE